GFPSTALPLRAPTAAPPGSGTRHRAPLRPETATAARPSGSPRSPRAAGATRRSAPASGAGGAITHYTGAAVRGRRPRGSIAIRGVAATPDYRRERVTLYRRLPSPWKRRRRRVRPGETARGRAVSARRQPPPPADPSAWRRTAWTTWARLLLPVRLA